MAAARAMLDEIHDTLPARLDDTNSYVLGSIGRHNVVITCLPEAQYGTNNAANIVTNMKRTFPSIRAGLMVGIGGGVPSKENDIRLGDIVVGTRVMQCDLGKIVGNGQLERTATPRIPHLLLMTAVSTLRAKHELGPSQVPSILERAMAGQSNYHRPTSPDRLFQSTYVHDSQILTCDGCELSKLVSRSDRSSNDVMIHYGAIASGNQVMKSGTTRDEIAQQLDVICFEMEAAGLMDTLPCLPIRGICDYSDSHKSKEWQRYAAATAAAYAKELIGELPLIEGHGGAHSMSHLGQGSSFDRRQELLHSLRFEQMDSRKSTIEAAHTKTCQWFLNHPDYQAWLDPEKLVKHHGFLWISGKPGAGKSTIMKFAYSKSKVRRKHGITASFFFNARGEYLEKSIIGMYRSLLLQLLEGYSDLQSVFDNSELIPQTQCDSPPLNVLKDLFRNAIFALGRRSFTCFIDALDECDEQQVVDMVQYFEGITEQSAEKGIPLRICFSSRHYPYISVQWGIRLTLEDQGGHADDLEIYITNRLQIKDPLLKQELRIKLLEKAAGVFMWVVLVVNILNKEYRRGALALRKRLAEIPSDLSELFKDIITRDNENMEGLLLCVLWILYAKRPLQPKEFYHAIWSGLLLDDLADTEIPDVTVQDPHGGGNVFNMCVISSSKGLAEITKAKQPTVQFIHESVRDFLIKDKGLQQLWPDLGFRWDSQGQEKLKQCCNLYINHDSVRGFINSQSPQTEISDKYPFLEYASRHVLYHANAAATTVSQDQFLSTFPLSSWVTINNIFEKFKIRHYSPDANLFYILAENGFSELIRTRMKVDSNIHVVGERYEYPLFAALANNHKDAVAAILNSPSCIIDGVDITEGLNHRQDIKEYKNRTPLSWAAQTGRISIVKLLLQTGAVVDEMDRKGIAPLLRASQGGHEAIARLLVDKGADINAPGGGSTPLTAALSNKHEAIARLLVDKGADINATGGGSTPLTAASSNGYEAVARLLLDRGADINTTRGGSTPLTAASSNGYEAVARLLLDRGADINTTRGRSTPLIAALSNKHEAIARLLLDRGADVNATGGGSTPLIAALSNKHEAIARLLVDKGADINATGGGSTPLTAASFNGYEAVARLLLDRGADINTTRGGSTPLTAASSNGYEAVARLLLDRGADVNATGGRSTPLIAALSNKHEAIARLLLDRGADVNATGGGSTPLIAALSNKHEAIARLLLDRGADVNAANVFGYTPLIFASRNGHEVIARLLLDRGADVNTANNYGDTPLIFASQNGHEALARLLLDRGADVNTADNYGDKPLIFASQNGHEALARLLLDRGADVNTIDKDGRTSLRWASLKGYEAVTRLLLDRGADINTNDASGRTPPSMASLNSHGAVAQLLLDRGADTRSSDI